MHLGWAQFTQLRTCLSALLTTERCPSTRPGLSAAPRLLQPLLRLVILSRSSLAACAGLGPLKEHPVSNQPQVTQSHPAPVPTASNKGNSCCYSNLGLHTPTLFCITGLAWLQILLPSLRNLTTLPHDLIKLPSIFSLITLSERGVQVAEHSGDEAVAPAKSTYTRRTWCNRGFTGSLTPLSWQMFQLLQK